MAKILTDNWHLYPLIENLYQRGCVLLGEEPLRVWLWKSFLNWLISILLTYVNEAVSQDK